MSSGSNAFGLRGRDRGDQRLVAQRGDVQPLGRSGEADDDGVEPLVADRLDELVRGTRLEHDLDVRRLGGELLERARDAGGKRVRHVADAELRTRRGVRVARRALRDLGLVQDPTGLDEQRGAGRGEGDAAVGAVEQPHAQLCLELADLLADGGLRHVQALGGAAEVQLLRDRDEVPQVSQLHG